MNRIAFATSNNDQGDTDGNDQQGSSNDNQSPDSFDQFQTDNSSPSSSDKSQSDQSPSLQESLCSNQLKCLGSAFVGGLVGDAAGGPSGLLLSCLANGGAYALQK
jgi:hypothetical protein